MLKQGVYPKVVQERLGHANIRITLDTYGHVTPGLQEAAAKRFDDAFAASYNRREEKAVENHY
jgi:integrase